MQLFCLDRHLMLQDQNIQGVAVAGQKPRSVVLLSGGMDSCVCASLAARDTNAAALHISYGQRTQERERRSFERICDFLEIQTRLVLQNESLSIIGGSALTDRDIEVPEAGAAQAIGRGGIPAPFVSFPQPPFLGATRDRGPGPGGR